MSTDETARRYRRPLILGIGASVLAEFTIFLVWGVILYPEGDLVAKLLWTVLFCGVGMGSAVGALLVLLVVDRLEGVAAIAASSALSLLVLGVACNLLCFRLDAHYFHYFGAVDSPALFIGNGLVMSGLGGAAAGWLMFTERGRRQLRRVGL